MAIVNFGSLNLDHVYTMPRFVQPGETLQSAAYSVCCGGKGLNQSVAAARAGATVMHCSPAGTGSAVLTEYLAACGVDISRMGSTATPQGHAIIQVSPSGENSIILYPGSNAELTKQYADSVLNALTGSCYIMLQNETSNVPYLIEQAAARGHKVVFNASPFDASLLQIDLKQLSWLLVNEIEGAQMTGEQAPERILAALRQKNPGLGIVLTLGTAGSICACGGDLIRQGIFKVKAVDTTGAGDTFTGYFIAALDAGIPVREALRRAAAASAIAVTRKGAGPSIPAKEEVDAFLAEQD